jgi:hypothetical protein
MALELEALRKAVAEAKGETYVSSEPQLEGAAKSAWEERKALQAEIDSLKANSGGRDEVSGTPQYERVQEIGASLKHVEARLAEHGVVIPKGVEALKKVFGEDTDQGINPEISALREKIDVIAIEIERDGEAFLDGSERFVRFLESQSPHGSTLGEDLMGTEEYQTILAASREAPDAFRDFMKIKRELGLIKDAVEAASLKKEIGATLETLQRIFTITDKNATELWGTILREQRKISQEYRSDRVALEEGEYLQSTGSLLRVVCEQLEAMKKKVDGYRNALN